MIEQGSPEWHERRRGKVTGSRVADILRKGRSGGSSKSRDNYRTQLVLERMTGVVEETYTSPDMQHGKDTEAVARAHYEFVENVPVELAEFVDHPTIKMFGASPDGLVGDDGGTEIKCPKAATHVATLRTGNIEPDYLTQIKTNLSVTGRKWWDFVSYCPSMPDHLRYFRKRIYRDQTEIIKLETEVVSFLKEVDEELAALQSIRLEKSA